MATKTKAKRINEHSFEEIKGQAATGYGRMAEQAKVQAKFAATRREMAASLIERDDEIDLVLTALIAQENPLLVGPPGTGKSLLLDSLMRWMNGSRFPILFTKFTTPEEVFGPISVAGLKADSYRRITTDMLPEADVAFLDEIFKASSAILNTLLRILNERQFKNGGTVTKCPLKIAVAASNEFPGDSEGGKELGALFDRFLFRKHVKPIVTQHGRQRLLWERDHAPKFSTDLTPAEIDQAHAEAMALTWTDDAKNAMSEILRELAKEGIVPGDRRQYKSVGAAQAYAYLCGASDVQPEHLEILQHVLWDDPAEQPAKVAQVVARIANPVGMKVNSLLLEAEQVLAATDAGDLTKVAVTVTKLQEIWKQLNAIPNGNGRVEKAKEYVAAEGKKLKLESMRNL